MMPPKCTCRSLAMMSAMWSWMTFTSSLQLENNTQFGPSVRACENRRCGEPAVVNRSNAALTSAGAQVLPSAVNGSAVQFEESGTRASISDAGSWPFWPVRRMPPGVSVTKVPASSKCPT
jgi:hypothetical protein